MPNSFIESIMKAMENQTSSEDALKDVNKNGASALQTETDGKKPDGLTETPGDPDMRPRGNEDPNAGPEKTDTPGQRDGSSETAMGGVEEPGDDKSNPDPAKATESDGENGTLGADFKGNVTDHKANHIIPIEGQKNMDDKSGNTGDPVHKDGDPAKASGNTKPNPTDSVTDINNDKKSGTADNPGVNGNPVSKSGEPTLGQKNEFKKAADDKDGTPDSPGVDNATPAPSLDSFIDACQHLKVGGNPGAVVIPDGMSMESYIYELGMGAFVERAMEATLTAAERRALPDSEFGLPDQRGWPLNDESHVRSAIQNFHWCPKDRQKELAKNILKAMRKFGMKDITVTEGSAFLKYYPDAKVVARKKPEKKA